jgi:hypothetical protein
MLPTFATGLSITSDPTPEKSATIASSAAELGKPSAAAVAPSSGTPPTMSETFVAAALSGINTVRPSGSLQCGWNTCVMDPCVV